MRIHLTTAVALAAIFTVTTLLYAVPVTGGTGPGGVDDIEGTTGLRFWLKADSIAQANGTNVASWTDSTANAISFTQGTPADQPTFNTGVVNGQPAVAFSGDGNELTGPGIVSGFGEGQLFMVMQSAADPAVNTSIAGAPHNIGAGTYHHTWTDGRVYDGFLSTSRPTPPSSVSATLGVSLDTFHIYNAASGAGGGSGTWESRVNGSQYLVRNDNSINASGGTIIGNSHASRRWDGDLAEFVLFDRVLDDAERILVENALSAKYDVNLLTATGPSPASDFYAGDTLDNGNYDFDVFGVGNDGTNSVTNSGSAGFGIEATAGLDAGEYVLAGHKTITNGVSMLDEAKFAGERWDRVWFVDTNDNEVTTMLGFDFDDAGLGGSFDVDDSFRLLYSETNDFNWQIFDIFPSVDAGEQLVTFNVPANLLSTGYFTLGINAVQIPEPSTFCLVGLALLGLVRHARRRTTTV